MATDAEIDARIHAAASTRYYIAIIHKDRDADYSISFPDFPDCISSAKSLALLRWDGEVALARCIDGMIKDGKAIPSPTSLVTISAPPENREHTWVVHIPDPLETRAWVDVTIELPKVVLAEVERQAKAQGLTSSGFINEAIKHELGRLA